VISANFYSNLSESESGGYSDTVYGDYPLFSCDVINLCACACRPFCFPSRVVVVVVK
jgi:hypothetical protein